MGIRANRWIAPPSSLELKHDEIHLWRADLDREMHSYPVLEQTLAPEERRKAHGFRSELERCRYIVARGALRTILAWYLKMTPGSLVFSYGLQGKPELAGGGVRFNVSHSQGLALFAITRASDLGVDVERVRPGIEKELATSLFLPPQAIRLLEALPKFARPRAFLRGWTRMEAYSKARGVGLTLGFENFDVFLNRNRPRLLYALGNPKETAAFWLYDLPAHGSYVAALAARGRKCRLRYWGWRVNPGAGGPAGPTLARLNGIPI